jgi:hypothetical protein
MSMAHRKVFASGRSAMGTSKTTRISLKCFSSLSVKTLSSALKKALLFSVKIFAIAPPPDLRVSYDLHDFFDQGQIGRPDFILSATTSAQLLDIPKGHNAMTRITPVKLQFNHLFFSPIFSNMKICSQTKFRK